MEAVFPLHELLANSKALFGVNPEVVAGAFRNIEETQISKKQATLLIKKFLKEEVK